MHPWRISPSTLRKGLDQMHMRLYSDLAYLWPIISPPEEYEEEARYWRQALRDRLGPGEHRILELGAGGGHNLSHLTSDFHATAVDISPQMLALSMKLNPGVQHHLGDMRSVRLGLTFDGVLIHDAISYMLTEDDLRAAFATAKIHLRPGGVLLAAPDLVREVFKDTTVLNWVRKKGEVEVSIQEYLHDPNPADTNLESIFTYTINEGGKQWVERDTHIMGLFAVGTWTRLMQEAGFEVETLSLPAHESGYGGFLFVGTAAVDGEG